MAGFSTASNEHLIRSNLWSTDLKKFLEDEMIAMKYVRFLTDFPDGDTLNIPSIGQAEVFDYAEGQAIRYSAMDTGNFTFTINKYKSSGTYITEKMKQDSYVFSQLIAEFVPSQRRALEKSMEVDILATFNSGQTASNVNAINGADHRWVGAGTNETMSPQDFAKARYSLSMANVPLNNLVAIVHPSVAYALETMTNLVNVSNNPHWEGIVSSGISTGMRFVKNIYGFDIYESQNIAGSLTDTIGGRTVAAGVANVLFSATSPLQPVVGVIRQAPKVDSEYNKDLQREEYVTTCRYGFKTFRPENLCVVLTDIDQVS